MLLEIITTITRISSQRGSRSRVSRIVYRKFVLVGGAVTLHQLLPTVDARTTANLNAERPTAACLLLHATIMFSVTWIPVLVGLHQ